MPLRYTVDDVCYEGISRVTKWTDTVDPNYTFVIAWVEGEPELWIVQPTFGLSTLRNYYRDKWGSSNPLVVLLQFPALSLSNVAIVKLSDSGV